MKLTFSAVVLSILALTTSVAFAAQYSNPVLIRGFRTAPINVSVADPTVIQGDDGWMYSFSTNRLVLKSKDGCTWQVHSRNIIPNPTWGDDYYGRPINARVWAPDVRKVQNKWIYYYSLSAWGLPCGIGYAVADNVAGPYVDKGKLFTCSEIGIENCIDPQVIVEDDGSVFMVMGSFRGIYLIELTRNGMGCLRGVEYQKETKTLIAGYPGSWDGSTYEGSYIVKKDGAYYYFGSVGTCCEGEKSTYRVYVARADDIRGPYCGSDGVPITQSGYGKTYGNLVVKAPASVPKSVVGPGHNSVFVDANGDWWLYYHAFTSLDSFRTRHLFMDKLLWDKSGFPYVENKTPSFQTPREGPKLNLPNREATSY